MVAVALVIGFIHLSYIRPRYGDSLPLILSQFFPLYFLWKILFGEKPILNQKPVSVSVTSEQSSYGCAHSNNVIAFPGSYCSEM